jgi:hypothetical protein
MSEENFVKDSGIPGLRPLIFRLPAGMDQDMYTDKLPKTTSEGSESFTQQDLRFKSHSRLNFSVSQQAFIRNTPRKKKCVKKEDSRRTIRPSESP